MLLTNAFRPDPRVAHEAQALASHGYRVTVICWDRDGTLPSREDYSGVEIIRVQNIHSKHGLGWRQLFYLPRFWSEAIGLSTRLRPDVIHCHDLDTLYAGLQIKKRLKCPLVYDAHEHYPALMSLYLPSPLVMMLVYWERWLMRHVDTTITASTVLRDEFLARGLSPVITLGNYQDLTPQNSALDDQARKLRIELDLASDDLLVAYIGGFSRNRMLTPLIEAAALLPQVQFHIWGDGLQRPVVEQAATQHPNVYYHGWIEPANLPYYFRAADIIYYCLRLDYPGAIYNAPNTLSHSMLAGRPIIANDVGDLGRIVRNTQCGILIDDAVPEAIAIAIKQLQDSARRAQIGANARQAAETTYNWAMIQKELIKIYQTLIE
jgi:glycosyltransferase involved in cell wall biosynthesis